MNRQSYTDESERQTRRVRIDTKLRALGWSIVDHEEGLVHASLTAHAVREYPTENGPADYALFVGGAWLGILEAKRLAVGPQNVLEQAKRYSLGATVASGNWQGYRVPFLYSSNGETHWFIDIRDDKALSRQIGNLHTPAALVDMAACDQQKALSWLQTTPVTDIARLRPYQQQAVSDTETALGKRKRALLIAMATGTGKTFTIAALLYRLLASGYARRILFLVDRKALAAQAVRELASFNTPHGRKFDQEYEVYSQRFKREDFDENESFDPKVLPEAYLTRPDGTQTFVYVCTIQRMAINLFGREGGFAQDAADPELTDDADCLDIPIHAFDVIIADECHRGYTAADDLVWQRTIDHFDAVKIGLTATPAKHTVAVFGEPVFRYTVQEAIHDGWLVDYDAVAIRSEVRIKGTFLKEGERVHYVDTKSGTQRLDHLEDERKYESTDIESKITVPESNRKIIQEIARYAREHQARTGRFPKTLIFAVNDIQHTSHSDQLVSICREVFGEGDAFVQKITGNKNVDRPLQRIREFRNRPAPKVVVSVDMLSTGIDIPALEFIVFLRPVKSRILWEQMLGRGTRRCPDINKTHFTIFDCFGGTLIEYFKDTGGFEVDRGGTKPVGIAEIIENIWQNIEREYNVRRLVGRLRRIEKDMSGEARDKFAKFIPDGDIGAFAEGLPDRMKNDFTTVMGILRDKEFQELLEHYPRAPRTFLIAPDAPDKVTSEYKIRRGDKLLVPADYLYEFSAFVAGKRDEIDALRVLLNKPKSWSVETLEDLRRLLRDAAFSEEDLRKAHEIVHKKPLVDVISMVKHAAMAQEPLLTAAERVDRALANVCGGASFSEEQKAWLALIREHLITHLSIGKEDFVQIPIFERKGGISRARKVFSDRLDEFLSQLNEAMVA